MSGELERRSSLLSPAKRALLERMQNGQPRSPLVDLRPGASGMPLFCVHPVSGSAYCYLELARMLDHGQTVYGLESPGLEGQAAPLRSLPALSQRYLDAIDRLGASEGCALLGWSMGGGIAFDMAQRLAASGSAPAVLVLIDALVPRPRELPPERDLVARFMRELLLVSGIAIPGVDATLDRQGPSCEPTQVFAEIEALGLAPPEIDAGFLARRYAVFRANVEALLNYGARGGYDGRCILITGTESPSPHAQWEAICSDLEIHEVAGDHHSIWTGQALRELGALVGRCLEPREAARWR